MSNTGQTGQMFVVFQLCFLWAGTVGDYLKDFGRFSLLELFFFIFFFCLSVTGQTIWAGDKRTGCTGGYRNRTLELTGFPWLGSKKRKWFANGWKISTVLPRGEPSRWFWWVANVIILSGRWWPVRTLNCCCWTWYGWEEFEALKPQELRNLTLV